MRPSSVLADDQKFSVSFDLSYKVHEDGTTTVTQNFQLTNLTTEFYSSEYVTNLGKLSISSLRAFDRTGTLPIQAVKTSNGQEMHIQFRDAAVGLGKTLLWTIAYETPDIAHKDGRLWEIFIPKPQDPGYITNYTIGLYVPISFGVRVIVKPQPSTDTNVWSKNEITGSGITATYSDQADQNPYQNYDFRLRYHLYNGKLFPGSLKIALPPDTNYQKIFLYTLNPKPVNVTLDGDGNWLAEYTLGPAARLDVLATGSAIVSLKPRFPPLGGTVDPQTHLEPQQYWETNQAKIYQLAKSLAQPDKIFDFVVKNLQYSSNGEGKKERQGALAALTTSFGTSLEFTDLFIALARAAGIPSRELDGYAAPLDKSTASGDQLHSWPEYFDSGKNSWLMVDPAWQNTTRGLDYYNVLDTNHLVLAIKGLNSSAPAPAGAYKTGNENTRDIEISYHDGDLDETQTPNLGFRASVPDKMTSGFPATGQVILENYGPVPFPDHEVTVTGSLLDVKPTRVSSGVLLPFSSQAITVALPAFGFNEEKDDIITVEFAGQRRDNPIRTIPFYKNNFILVVGGLTALGILSLIAQIARSLFIQRRRR